MFHVTPNCVLRESTTGSSTHAANKKTTTDGAINTVCDRGSTCSKTKPAAKSIDSKLCKQAWSLYSS